MKKTIKLKYKNQFKSLTHIHYGKSIPINHKISNPNFFDIHEIFNDYINIHNNNIDIYLVKCVFKLIFNNYTPHINTVIHHKTTNINLKTNLWFSIDYFTEAGHKFSLIIGLN